MTTAPALETAQRMVVFCSIECREAYLAGHPTTTALRPCFAAGRSGRCAWCGEDLSL